MLEGDGDEADEENQNFPQGDDEVCPGPGLAVLQGPGVPGQHSVLVFLGAVLHQVHPLSKVSNTHFEINHLNGPYLVLGYVGLPPAEGGEDEAEAEGDVDWGGPPVLHLGADEEGEADGDQLDEQRHQAQAQLQLGSHRAEEEVERLEESREELDSTAGQDGGHRVQGGESQEEED